VHPAILLPGWITLDAAFVYFDDDAEVRAPYDAPALQERPA
jgi:hypothetical protein